MGSHLLLHNKHKGNTMANLNPVHKFKEGNNANPLGRPKKEFSMTNALREILAVKDPKTKVEKYKDLLNVAVNKAMEGDNDMLKYLINRIEGMPSGTANSTTVENLENLVIVVKEKE